MVTFSSRPTHITCSLFILQYHRRAWTLLRAAIYTRVSTSEQASEGFSLDAQLDRLRAYCTSQDWTIVGVYTDEGISAKNTERPELQRLLQDIENRLVDVVLVYKLDRLTRSVIDLHALLERFERHSVGFKSATEVFDTTTAMGRLFITIIAALAQWERENLAERTKLGQIEMTKQGRWSGGHAPFGYDYMEGELRVNEPQARVVREIFDRYTGGEGTAKILQWLNNPHSPQLAPRQRWTQWALKYVLRNPLYAGFVRYGYRDVSGRKKTGVIVEKGAHDAIVLEATFVHAEAVRERRTTMPGRSSTGTYVLTGVLRCGLCGASVVGRTVYRARKEEGPARRYYMCAERQHSGLCKLPRIQEGAIEQALLSELAKYAKQPTAQSAERQDDFTSARRSIESELVKLKHRRERFMDAYGDGQITSAELRQQLDRITEQERKFAIQIEGLQPKRIDRGFVEEILRTFEASWNIADADARKELVRLIVKRVEVSPGPELKVTFID